MSSENVLDLGALIELQENEGNIVNDDNYDEIQEDESVEDDQIEDQDDNASEADESEEETEEIVPVTEEDSEEEEETEVSPAQQHFEFLKEQGLLALPEDFEFDGSSDSLEAAYEHTRNSLKKEALQAILGNMSPDFRDAFRYAVSGGSFNDFLKTTGFSGEAPIDISSEPGQIAVIRNYYKETTNYSDDKIDSMIDRLKKLDAIEEEAQDAVEYLDELKKQRATELAQQQEQARKDAEKALEEQRKALENAITNSEFIPSQRKTKVKAYLNNIQVKEDGENTEFNRHIRNISINPEHKAQLADILLSAYDPNKGFDLSRYIKQGKSQATSEFKESLEKKLDVKTRMSKGSKTYKPSKEVSWAEILKQYD